jgi:type IV pilus assembly protein PilB
MAQPAPKRLKIGELLVQAGMIDDFQLQTALGEQRRWGGRLGTALVKLGFVEEPVLMRFLARRLDIPLVQLGDKRPAPEVLELVSADLAQKYHCLPLFVKREQGRNVLYLAMEDPTDLQALDELSFRVGMTARAVLVAPSVLRGALKELYAPGRGGAVRTGSFDEMPLEPGDTAPVLDAGQLEMPDAPLPTPHAPVSAPPADRPVLEPVHAPEPTFEAAPPPAPEAAKPREVPTRLILRALTQLLIEKGVLSREELMERLRRDEP